MAYRNFRKQKHKGFTLIELLVVIAIIGVLSGLVLSSLTEARKKADDTKRVEDMQQMRNAIEIYALKHKGDYPPFAVAAEQGNFAQNEKEDNVLYAKDTLFYGILSLLTPKANAAVVHTEPACLAFDALANQLKLDGDISAIPSDPKDADTLTCYKAYKDNTNGYVAVYAYTWQKYQSNPASNKKVGFIVSKNSEINASVVNSVCAGTNALYGSLNTIGVYPVLNPTNSSTLCTPGTNLAADTIIGVTAGDATIGTSLGGGGGSANGSTCASNGDCLSGHCNGGYCSAYASGQVNGSSCTYNADCSSSNCVTGVCQATTSGSCSDPAYTDKSNCENSGSCSNSSYTTKSTCEDIGNGSCSNSSYSNQSDCSGHGTCSNTSYSDKSSCEAPGYCSNSYYSDKTSCEAAGYCSNSSYYDKTSCETAGYCSGAGSYSDKTSCEAAGYCSSSSYYDKTSCEAAGSCDMAFSNKEECENNSGVWTPFTWTPYNNSWNLYNYSWNSYNYSWNSDYSWTPYTWNGNTWTANIWTP